MRIGIKKRFCERHRGQYRSGLIDINGNFLRERKRKNRKVQTNFIAEKIL